MALYVNGKEIKTLSCDDTRIVRLVFNDITVFADDAVFKITVSSYFINAPTSQSSNELFLRTYLKIEWLSGTYSTTENNFSCTLNYDYTQYDDDVRNYVTYNRNLKTSKTDRTSETFVYENHDNLDLHITSRVDPLTTPLQPTFKSLTFTYKNIVGKTNTYSITLSDLGIATYEYMHLIFSKTETYSNT